MKGKELHLALKAGMEEEFQRDPSIRAGKKLTGFLLALWILSRVFFLVMDLICSRIGFIEFNPANIAAFAVSLLFALLLYRGAGKLALLPLVGGLIMLVNIFREGTLRLLSLDLDPVLHLYVISYVLAAAVTVLAMLLLLLLPACRAYAESALRVTKELQEEQKEHRL